VKLKILIPLILFFIFATFGGIIVENWLSSNSGLTNIPKKDQPRAGEITIKGTMVCLPHKNTEGPQTLECAFGLKDGKGNYYGLRDSDPEYKNVSGLPMNQEVTIKGEFTPREDNIYQSIGVITIEDVE
jgi:hypothetical protein